MSNQFRVTLQERSKREMQLLPNIIFQNRIEVESQLKNLFGRRLYWISKDDEKRLLTWAVWSERYAVTIGWILRCLIPYYQDRFQKRRKIDHRKGLPCKIATLTGKFSEWLIKQQLQKEFPDGENRELQRQLKREQIVREREERETGEEVMTRRKRLTDYEVISAYVDGYENRIRERRKQLERERQKPQKPYRGSPWV